MAKRNNTIFEIFLQGLGLYFTNIDRFVWYMFFPVLGQLLGFILTVVILYNFNQNQAFILSKVSIVQTQAHLNILLAVLLMPVVLLWLKAFWDYMVAYSAVNSMTENMLKSERVYDFPAHTMMVTRRSFSFLCLVFLYMSLILLSLTIVFAGFIWVLMIYFAFVFQIFLFEPELSPIDCFKKSSEYVRGKFKQTFLMVVLVGALTYIILPQIMLSFFDAVTVIDYFKGVILPYITEKSLDWLNMPLSAMGLHMVSTTSAACFIVKAFITVLVIQFLLPLRVICMCLWYKNFHNDSGSMKKFDDRILDRAGANKKAKKNK